MVSVLLLAFALFFFTRHGVHKDVRRALVDSAILFSTITVVFAEMLSLFNLYKTFSVLTLWILVCLACFMLCRNQLIFGVKELTCKTGKALCFRQPDVGVGERLFEYAGIIVILMFALVTFVIAIVWPPLNYDAYTSHLVRIFFWMRYSSVHNYPTGRASQLYQGPFHAFTMLQTMILSRGKDWYLNLPQWFSYIGSVIVASLISAELGLKRSWQIATSVLVVTIPMAIVQSVTPQNDLTIAFWVAASVYYVLRLIKDKELTNWKEIGCLIGVSVGVAVLSGLNAAVALLPFAFLVVVVKLRQKRFKNFFLASAMVIACILAINIGYFVRNAIDLDGDFLASSGPGIGVLRVETWDPRYRAVLMLKNLSLNLGSPSETLSDIVDNSVSGISSVLDVNIDSPFITIPGREWRTHQAIFSHDRVPNPIQSALALLTFFMFPIFAFFVNKSRERHVLALAYLSACIASFSLVALNFMFVYSAPRYLLPSLVISMPIVAYTFAFSRWTKYIGVVLVICAVVYGKMPLDSLRLPLMSLQDNLRNQTRSWEEWRYWRQELILYTEDSDFVINTVELINQKELRRIGVHHFHNAIFPILNHFTDVQRYEVSYINAIFHDTRSEGDFLPQAVIAILPSGDIAPMKYSGLTFIPVNYSCSTIFDIQHVLLLEESLVTEDR